MTSWLGKTNRSTLMRHNNCHILQIEWRDRNPKKSNQALAHQALPNAQPPGYPRNYSGGLGHGKSHLFRIPETKN